MFRGFSHIVASSALETMKAGREDDFDPFPQLPRPSPWRPSALLCCGFSLKASPRNPWRTESMYSSDSWSRRLRLAAFRGFLRGGMIPKSSMEFQSSPLRCHSMSCSGTSSFNTPSCPYARQAASGIHCGIPGRSGVRSGPRRLRYSAFSHSSRSPHELLPMSVCHSLSKPWGFRLDPMGTRAILGPGTDPGLLSSLDIPDSNGGMLLAVLRRWSSLCSFLWSSVTTRPSPATSCYVTSKCFCILKCLILVAEDLPRQPLDPLVQIFDPLVPACLLRMVVQEVHCVGFLHVVFLFGAHTLLVFNLAAFAGTRPCSLLRPIVTRAPIWSNSGSVSYLGRQLEDCLHSTPERCCHLFRHLRPRFSRRSPWVLGDVGNIVHPHRCMSQRIWSCDGVRLRVFELSRGFFFSGFDDGEGSVRCRRCSANPLCRGHFWAVSRN